MNEERLYEKLNDYKRACTRLENAINITIEDILFMMEPSNDLNFRLN